MKDEYVVKNKNINRGFRKLDIWKLSIELFSLVHFMLKKTKELPLKVKAQIEDSTLSISSNIAEGYSRRTKKETLRFYEIALASCAESYSQMFALFNNDIILKDDFEKFDGLHYEVENKIIRMNQELIKRLNNDPEWQMDYESNTTNQTDKHPNS